MSYRRQGPGSVLVSGRATQLRDPERKPGRENHGWGRGG